ncbi:putative N-acetylated-alpha-linked acidic dipeptidase [Patiria miniata]|uniref:glutamate carboxypeptidase II n=1 Tax=Patiria miniata TaxID=46514 RepID=A0A913ZPS4_PATMI|nr:putative N-acetylated-alpha-linked acidic dipeptidase [Patiria miniata]
MNPKVVIGIAATVTLAVGIGVGILLGHFVTAPATAGSGKPTASAPTAPPSYLDAIKEADASISGKLINGIVAENIRSNLMYLSNKSHVAGSPVSKEQAEWVRDNWLAQGLDSAKIVTYQVLLSYPPDYEDPKQNTIQLLNAAGDAEHTTQEREPPLEPGNDNPVADNDILAPFNAYSADGEIEGDLVYVNYGRVEDFQELERVLSIDVTGKICIARYAKIYRGDKATNAEKAGCIGLILYSDPKDYAVEGAAVYPDGIYLPGTGTQRGSLMLGSGDPRTPGYPAVESAYRVPLSNVTGLPSIPVHPIGYNDAAVFLSIMGGDEVTAEWAGNLPGVTYRYGPGFNASNVDKKVKMNIYNENRMATAYNVIGTIKGSVEPDRYVIIGNHRDAWGYGAIDPSSGTACLMEMSRVIGQLVKDGWRPRRTIMFGSWGAEEYGLIGSNEWVEEYAKNLGARTVAYLNQDIAVKGTFVLEIAGTPNLYNAIYSAARKVADPDPKLSQTVYDTWKERDLVGNTVDGHPHIGTLGSGSDYAPFLQVVGISAADFTYTYDKKTILISGYPMYHSVYETFKLVDMYYDPGFPYHRAITQLVSELARNLADSVVLPMDVAVYAEHVQEYYVSLREGSVGKKMIAEGIMFDDMQSAVNNLTDAANKFKAKVESVDKTDVLMVRMLNDQMTLFERAFSDPQGLPDRPFVRHIVFAPSSRDNYASDKFPGIVDAMFDIENNPDPEKWNFVKKQLSIVIYTIQSAASVLMEVA